MILSLVGVLLGLAAVTWGLLIPNPVGIALGAAAVIYGFLGLRFALRARPRDVHEPR